MVSDIFIEEVLDMIADELVGGNPARALAQLNILLQKLEPLRKTHLFSTARTLLYISRALHLLGASDETEVTDMSQELFLVCCCLCCRRRRRRRQKMEARQNQLQELCVPCVQSASETAHQFSEQTTETKV